MPVDGSELPDGGAEGGVLGHRQQGPRRTQERLLRGPEAVEDHRDSDLYEHSRNRSRGYAARGDESRPRDALGGEAHGPYGEAVGVRVDAENSAKNNLCQQRPRHTGHARKSHVQNQVSPQIPGV